MHGGFETIRNVVDIPLVARRGRAQGDRRRCDSGCGLPPERPLALVSFGGYGLRQLPLDRLDCLRDWGIVVSSPGEEPQTLPAGVHNVREDAMYDAGLRYEDLVGAVDVVITKPGYGIISDCVANGTAMLYTSRGRFRGIRGHGPRDAAVPALPVPRIRARSQRQLERGLDASWSARRRRRSSRAIDGAEVVAAMIAGPASVAL